MEEKEFSMVNNLQKRVEKIEVKIEEMNTLKTDIAILKKDMNIQTENNEKILNILEKKDDKNYNLYKTVLMAIISPLIAYVIFRFLK